MKNPILFLFLCFPFFIFSQQWYLWNNIKKQDNAKEIQQTSYSWHIKKDYEPTGIILIITKS